MNEELIGKKVKIVMNLSDGFEEGSICKIASNNNREPNLYNLSGIWENLDMEFEHFSNEFEVLD